MYFHKKYWPKEDNNPLDVSSKKILNPKKDNPYEKKPEHIIELETSRSNKEVHISECPAVSPNTKASPACTNTKSSNSKSK